MTASNLFAQIAGVPSATVKTRSIHACKKLAEMVAA